MKTTKYLSIALVLALMVVALSSPGAALAQPPAAVADCFVWPLGAGVTSRGGYTFLQYGKVDAKNYEYHPGVDLNVGPNSVGKPVYAIANGKVAEAHPSYGWYIMLEHTLPDGTKSGPITSISSARLA
jgi:murein DD-endopeptidase MepM/ murein hydrolase activator NlpD